MIKKISYIFCICVIIAGITTIIFVEELRMGSPLVEGWIYGWKKEIFVKTKTKIFTTRFGYKNGTVITLFNVVDMEEQTFRSMYFENGIIIFNTTGGRPKPMPDINLEELKPHII